MSTRQKSPLHPSALPIKGLTPQRTILVFNIACGIIDEGVVLEYPKVFEIEGMGKQLMVKLRSKDGVTEYHFLSDMGVIPTQGSWNDLNFTIDHRKRYLLPELVPHPYGSFFDYLEGLGSDFDNELPDLDS